MQASLRFPRCSGLRSVAAQRHSSLPARVVTPAKSGAERKVVVLQVAPAVRVAISEAYGLEPGAIATGKLVAGLKKLGFDYVFDTLVAADLTIMEEGTELLHRLTDHLEGHSSADEPMPMFSSCCPGWVAMVEKSCPGLIPLPCLRARAPPVEKSYPELIPYLSTCKSPQMMFGSVIKNFFATEAGVTASNIVSCSLMPCVRKQGEADRPAVNNSTTADGGCDVDHVITTVDVAGLLADAGIDLRGTRLQKFACRVHGFKHVITTTVDVAGLLAGAGIDLQELEPVEFDDPLGVGSGAAQLFGSTGGVMERAGSSRGGDGDEITVAAR
ncbi:hypothetical protein FOA52_003552 [Chlamydomonas sp. UWO 241]|nr:hypothetical protein FOA52_003552 [Chlamydomonas sp. UWO 241]